VKFSSFSCFFCLWGGGGGGGGACYGTLLHGINKELRNYVNKLVCVRTFIAICCTALLPF